MPAKKKTAKKVTAKKAIPKETTKKPKRKSIGTDLLKKANGRPPKYKISKELIEKANEYFKLCDECFQLPEKAGLCIYLGISRDTYSEYRKKGKFPDAIKGMDHYIESCWVRRLAGNAATGAIFYLKNAFRDHFKDRQETDITSQGEQIMVYIPKRGK